MKLALPFWRIFIFCPLVTDGLINPSSLKAANPLVPERPNIKIRQFITGSFVSTLTKINFRAGHFRYF